MTPRCAQVQARLAADGPRALRDDAAACEHLIACAQCFRVLEAVHELEQQISMLPALEPDPLWVAATVRALAMSEPQVATETVEAATPVKRSAAHAAVGVDPASSTALAGVAQSMASQADVDAAEEARFRRRVRTGVRRGSLFAALAAVVGVVVVVYWQRSPLHSVPHRRLVSNLMQETPEWLDDRAMRSTRHRFGIEGASPGQGPSEDPHVSREEAREMAQSAGIIGVLKSRMRTWNSPTSPYGRDAALGNDPMSALGALLGDQIGTKSGFGSLGLGATGRGGGQSIAAVAGKQLDTQRDNKRIRAGDRGGQRKPAHLPASTWLARMPAPSAIHAAFAARAHSVSSKAASASPRAVPDAPSANVSPAQAWLARHTTLAGVQFQDPNGYFENTYLPGDPVMRTLQAGLAARDRSSLLPASARSARLDDGVQRNAQPFDAPVNAALAAYLSASEAGITAERRMLVQVGLQATPRYGGRRPAMNVGIVLDLRGDLDAQLSASLRALLTAFASARDSSDRFALFTVGRAGAGVVTPEAFRSGSVSVALQRLLAAPEAPHPSMHEALQQALASVRGSDDPAAPIGSSVVVVITARALGAELPELLPLAHAGAIDGVQLSAFGVGSGVDAGELARLALAGQGNRRLIDSASEAATAVDRELSSVARAVARAVRLRIRLAPGVRLLEVLGSKRLDTPQVEQVRASENSIDQRLSRNLGIASDRGEDEEGIQIVIPTFYAGDSHVVLIDVVAPGPGPIADVSVRYKDLAQLGNGIARASLALPNLELARGALERNVLKNLIAYELSQDLKQAGDALAAGSPNDAGRALGGAVNLLEALGHELPGLSGDRDLAGDRELSLEYSSLLSGIERQEQRSYVADSLHFASLLKLQPRPDWESSAGASRGARP